MTPLNGMVSNSRMIIWKSFSAGFIQCLLRHWLSILCRNGSYLWPENTLLVLKVQQYHVTYDWPVPAWLVWIQQLCYNAIINRFTCLVVAGQLLRWCKIGHVTSSLSVCSVQGLNNGLYVKWLQGRMEIIIKFTCLVASKPVKQEVRCTVILPFTK